MGSRALATIIGVLLILASSPHARGELEFTDFVWTGGISSNWQQNGNWNQADFPSGTLHSASISSAGSLAINISAPSVTLAELLLDGTTAASNINLTGTGLLILQNDDNNVFFDPDGGAENGEVAPILTYRGRNDGRVLISSNGVAGATNTIAAPVRFSNSGFLEGVDVIGNKDLTLSGAIDITANLEDDYAQLRNYMSNGAKVVLNGPVSLTDPVGAFPRSLALNSYDTTDHGPVDDGPFPDDLRHPPRGTIEVAGPVSGTGGLSLGIAWAPRTEQVGNDPAPAPELPLSTIALRGHNTYTGDTTLSRANVVIGNDHAFGDPASSVVRQQGDSGGSAATGYNLVLEDQDRTIGNTLAFTQWITVKGNASLTWSGTIYQDAQRGFINLLPANETLKLTGKVYANRQAENPPAPGRAITFDGPGRTVITGGIHNYLPDPDGVITTEFEGNLRKRGTGAVVIDFDETNASDSPTDYNGYTYVDGGNLHFAQVNDLPSSSSRGISSSAGAVGLDSGLFQANNALKPDAAEFLNLLNNAAHLDAPSSSTTGGVIGILGVATAILQRYDSGGLMLGSGDYDKNLDFSGTVTANPLARAANMTLAAHEGGSDFTGTITPAGVSNGKPSPTNAFDPTGIPAGTRPNTFRLGGGSGVLTLPLNDQLVDGAETRNLLVTNGSEVRILGTHTYNGITEVVRGSGGTQQIDAAIELPGQNLTGDPVLDPPNRINTLLSVAVLANGGQASSIGNSSSAGTNLVVQGATLKYIGAAASTDRLFTVGTRGGTIDASGTGALNFSNTGPLAIDVAEDRTAFMLGGIVGNGNNEIVGVPGVNLAGAGIHPLDTTDLVPGMMVRDTENLITTGGVPRLVDDDSPILVTGTGLNYFNVGESDLTADNEDVNVAPTPWPGYGASTTDRAKFVFGPAPARNLTLSGSNSDSNTLNPLVTDASDINKAGFDGALGGKGSVGIRKTGVGKWVLTNSNSYSGRTNVIEGTLLVNGTQTGTGLTTVSNGAAFGGTGQIGGGLTMLEGSTFTATAVGGAIDALNVLGNVDLSALGNILAVTGTLTGTQTLLTFGGTLTGTFESTPGLNVNYLANSITISAAAGLVGDYNNDGKVNAADYTVWRDNLGAPGSALGANRDPANNGVIGTADYASWKSHFGLPGAGGGSFGEANVPEPTSALMLAIGLVTFLATSRRKALPV